jgi:hypothetical protein
VQSPDVRRCAAVLIVALCSAMCWTLPGNAQSGGGIGPPELQSQRGVQRIPTPARSGAVSTEPGAGFPAQLRGIGSP